MRKEDNVKSEKALFFRNFIKNPTRNASVIPSSKAATKAILKGIDFDQVDVIVELGPGSGVFTKEIIAQAKSGTKIVVIELEASYLDILERKFGDRIILENTSAHLLQDVLQKHGLEKVDLIVSGLPFLKGEIKEKVDQTIMNFTEKGTIYRFFTYMPPIMKKVYKEMPIEKKNMEPWNMPPFWVYGIN
ncbi:class I SAM-dependent methyltransferase [Parvicella tangerina]|uniref:Ornithine lipid N-methyltransferase n=1 Tax=Parvicella tangerina TaxID=2829795 RepID=A0A916JQE9_9FLAO|nr:rRNA adenine N-6-methyltransferase family protein [Parvicella tangerina]CAG5086698.1 Ornithine lipid N-methyltransferase [Parvicella tangerina]